MSEELNLMKTVNKLRERWIVLLAIVAVVVAGLFSLSQSVRVVAYVMKGEFKFQYHDLIPISVGLAAAFFAVFMGFVVTFLIRIYRNFEALKEYDKNRTRNGSGDPGS